MKVFHEFHARGKFERSLSATFIALILKISRAVDPIEFCLISLVSHIYKIIAKFQQTDLDGVGKDCFKVARCFRMR
jgi:hypothetical protein